MLLAIGVWIIFALLCLYVYHSRTGRNSEDSKSLIRRSWYLIYLFGFLVFITKNDIDTLFTHWKEYVIVLVVFIIIDALLFLELHFSKLGGQELKSARVQVGVTQKELDSVERKFGLIPVVLTSFEFVLYNVGRELYISQLEEFLNGYAKEEGLAVDLLPYNTEDEQERVLSDLGKSKDKAMRFLKQNRSIELEKQTLVLFPFKIFDYDYVVQIQTEYDDDKVTEVDGSVITTLIMTYDLAVIKIKNESGEE
ncbi:type II toxin-antitoxin system SpoIISA family toxin [Sporosarcina sp. G11-34]|uniref:type II toxin-antitoxin system SpoIISA family toxin n=1 Tax=Sporosarcina sp. G11-34 TaxID=2849605 RepID=UPI0022A95AB1|nr:type II toxin-antitoxin system SpoIISA family toxin [Sporosarcina sp. G11-34]